MPYADPEKQRECARRGYHRRIVKEHRRASTRYLTPRGRAQYLRNNARRRALQRDVPFTLQTDWVEEKLLRGVCEITGIPFRFTNGNGMGVQGFYSPSLDRTVPEKGYTPENVRVVLWGYNACKSSATHADVLVLVEALCTQNKR